VTIPAKGSAESAPEVPKQQKEIISRRAPGKRKADRISTSMGTLSRSVFVCSLLGTLAIVPAGAQVSVLTNFYDNARTGANLNETHLTMSNVTTNLFGKLFSYSVDGSIYAQPLYVPTVAIPGKGTHNIVYVATMNDKVYAFDADSNTGANASALWSVDFTNAAAGITAVPIIDLTNSNSLNIVGNVGIESTPVIDPATNTMYLLARTKENGAYVQRLHALDIASGAEQFGGPVAIQGSVPGTGGGSSGGTLAFDPKMHNQRAGLALVNGQVVIAWASHEDIAIWHGWVMAYNAATLQQASIFSVTPNGNSGGVWQSGRAPSIDAAQNLYLITGNGDWDGAKNFGESVLKMTTAAGLTLTDWFTPNNYTALNGADEDLGSSGTMLIPGTSLVLGGGKQGLLYLLNTASLGHEQATNSQIVQSLQATSGEIKSGTVYWNSPNHGPLIYLWAESDVLKAFHFNGATIDTTTAGQGVLASSIAPGATLAISANGSTAGSGILWASMPISASGDHGVVPGVVRAYDASNVGGTELWDSQQNASRDSIGNFAKFVPPTVANGKVYMATFSNNLSVYGLLGTDFSLSASPASATVAPGGTATYSVAVSPSGGFNGTVALSATGLPTGASAAFNPPSITGTGSSVLTVTTGTNTPAGTSTLTISGISGTLGHSTTTTLVVSSTRAKAIGINFVGRGSAMAGTESAGVIAKASWNNATGVSGAASALIDETHATTGAAVTWSSNNVWSTAITDTPGNMRMMKGYLDTSNTSVTSVGVSGLISNTNGYDVYVYIDGDNSGQRTGSYKISGAGITTTTITATDKAGTNFGGTFIQANNSTGNYVKFTIKATAFTITATSGTSTDPYKRAPLNAIQIIPK
jgi:hypothetical protein